jgi:hypothetical protein
MNIQEGVLNSQKREAYLKAQLDTTERAITDLTNKLAESIRMQELYSKCSDVLSDISMRLQENTTQKITDIITSMLQYIFESEEEFVIEVDKKRKTPIANFYIKTMKGGKELLVDPISGDGGGKVEVIALGLRICALLLQNPQTDRILFMDEPLRFLSSKDTSGSPVQSRALIFLKDLIQRYNIQVVAVTHNAEMKQMGDKVFDVRLNDSGFSTLTEVKDENNTYR